VRILLLCLSLALSPLRHALERPQSHTTGTRRIIIFLFLFGNFFCLPSPNIPPAQDGNNNNNALSGGGGLGDFMAWKKKGYGQSAELMAHGFLSRPTVFIFNA